MFHRASPNVAKNHFSLKHRLPGKRDLKPQFSLSSQSIQSSDLIISDEDNLLHDSEPQSHEIYDDSQLEDLVNDCDIIVGNIEQDENYLLAHYSNFLNKLANIKFVPQSTIQIVVNEFITNVKTSMKRVEQVLKNSLNSLVPVEKSEKVIADVCGEDPCLAALSLLDTEYKRIKNIQTNAWYVAPKEIVLNREQIRYGESKDSYHYVPIVESFKTLINDVSFKKMRTHESIEDICHGKYNDVKSGKHYKSNKYFNEHPDAYTLMLYSDAVEIKNPLGSAKGTYKLVQIFYTLGEIPRAQRSKVDRLQLVMVFKEKLLKKYSLHRLMKPLLKDLQVLEKGVVLDSYSNLTVRCGVLCYIADNLEASVVGGFSGSFSSRDVCRICHIQYEDLEDNISARYELWTREEYDNICAAVGERLQPLDDSDDSDEETVHDLEINESEIFVEESHTSDDDEPNKPLLQLPEDYRGVKTVCPFNVLESFHCVENLPCDLMHDLFEGSFHYINY